MPIKCAILQRLSTVGADKTAIVPHSTCQMFAVFIHFTSYRWQAKLFRLLQFSTKTSFRQYRWRAQENDFNSIFLYISLAMQSNFFLFAFLLTFTATIWIKCQILLRPHAQPTVIYLKVWSAVKSFGREALAHSKKYENDDGTEWRLLHAIAVAIYGNRSAKREISNVVSRSGPLLFTIDALEWAIWRLTEIRMERRKNPAAAAASELFCVHRKRRMHILVMANAGAYFARFMVNEPAHASV